MDSSGERERKERGEIEGEGEGERVGEGNEGRGGGREGNVREGRREGGREGEKEGEREGGREGGREGEREREKEKGEKRRSVDLCLLPSSECKDFKLYCIHVLLYIYVCLCSIQIRYKGIKLSQYKTLYLRKHNMGSSEQVY